MDGLVVINKQVGCTSRDVVNDLTHYFKTKKIGHTGTLDPIASGVLVCCLGKYTKLVKLLTHQDKEYMAEIKLGILTDTLDITGNILKESTVNITKEQIEKVFLEFPKCYEQTVPKYSAVKINGKKLYEYARLNKDIKLPTRTVNIYSLELLSFHNNIIKFKTKVSKGTYIRSLINDLCTKLNTIGTMSSLIRVNVGPFTLDKSYTIEDIKNNNYKLLKVEDIFNYPHLLLNKEEYLKVKNGAKLENKNNYQDKVLCIYDSKVIAIYEVNDNYLRSYIQL